MLSLAPYIFSFQLCYDFSSHLKLYFYSLVNNKNTCHFIFNVKNLSLYPCLLVTKYKTVLSFFRSSHTKNLIAHFTHVDHEPTQCSSNCRQKRNSVVSSVPHSSARNTVGHFRFGFRSRRKVENSKTSIRRTSPFVEAPWVYTWYNPFFPT